MRRPSSSSLAAAAAAPLLLLWLLLVPIAAFVRRMPTSSTRRSASFTLPALQAARSGTRAGSVLEVSPAPLLPPPPATAAAAAAAPPPRPVQEPPPATAAAALPLMPPIVSDEAAGAAAANPVAAAEMVVMDAAAATAAAAAAAAAEEEAVLAALAEAKTVTLRRMTLRDVAACFHIGEDIFSPERFSQLYRTWSPYEVTDAMSTDPELCLVAEAVVQLPARRGRKPKNYKKFERRVVGFVLGSITEKRKADESCGYVSWVAVAEDFQRQGIGTQLVQQLEGMFAEEGMRTVVADTPETNMPARCFLEGLGYGSPVSHVYMSLYFNAKESQDAPASSKPRRGGKNGLGKTKSRVKIRQMEVDDLSAVYELGEEVFTSELPNLYQIWSEAEVIDLFGSDAENCFVAEVEGKVAGFCLGTTIEKKHSSWRYGYLVWLAVSTKTQGLGVGKRLLHAFEAAMKEEGARICLIDTQSDNVAARSFFSKAGFRNFEDHRYYTKILMPREAATAEEEQAAGAVAGGAVGRKDAVSSAAGPSPAGRQGIPQPRLMRLTASKKKVLDS